MKFLNDSSVSSLNPVTSLCGNNVVLRMELNEGCANFPEFELAAGTVVNMDKSCELFAPCSLNEHDEVMSVFSAEVNDYGVMFYGAYHVGSEANTVYGKVIDGVRFKSGWSSRASVINYRLDVRYVDIGLCTGLYYGKMLELVAEQFPGIDVYIGLMVEDGEISINVAPYDVSQIKKYSLDKTGDNKMIILCADELLVAKGSEFIDESLCKMVPLSYESKGITVSMCNIALVEHDVYMQKMNELRENAIASVNEKDSDISF